MRRTSGTGIRRAPTACRRRPAARAAAFTLIEVLVVVAIVGIIIAVAAVNLFPDNAQLARRESGTLALSIEQARDSAWLGGRPTSVTFDEGRLRVWRLSADSWRPDPSRDRVFEQGTRLMGLYVDGLELKPGERLVFLPDGLGVAFRVALEVRGLRWAVEGDAAGAVTLVEG
jgi:general secretion pathway protein H